MITYLLWSTPLNNSYSSCCISLARSIPQVSHHWVMQMLLARKLTLHDGLIHIALQASRKANKRLYKNTHRNDLFIHKS